MKYEDGCTVRCKHAQWEIYNDREDKDYICRGDSDCYGWFCPFDDKCKGYEPDIDHAMKGRKIIYE